MTIALKIAMIIMVKMVIMMIMHYLYKVIPSATCVSYDLFPAVSLKSQINLSILEVYSQLLS